MPTALLAWIPHIFYHNANPMGFENVATWNHIRVKKKCIFVLSNTESILIPDVTQVLNNYAFQGVAEMLRPTSALAIHLLKCAAKAFDKVIATNTTLKRWR